MERPVKAPTTGLQKSMLCMSKPPVNPQSRISDCRFGEGGELQISLSYQVARVAPLPALWKRVMQGSAGIKKVQGDATQYVAYFLRVRIP